jgi:arginine/lysine/ornithine decarboxylase
VRSAPSLPRPKPVHVPRPSDLELDSVDTPRAAFFGPAEMVPAQDAVGRIAAEQITPYPPGIPALVPGERINAAVLEYLRTGLAAGMVLPDPTDPSLRTVRVTASGFPEHGPTG